MFSVSLTFSLLFFCFCRLLYEFPLMVLLSDAIGHVSRYGSQLFGPLDVEHLIIKEDMGFDLLQQRPLWSPGQEKGLIDLQAPATQGLQDTSAGTGGAAGRDQEGSDGTVDALVFDVELSLEFPQSLQETLQRALREPTN